MSAYGLVRISTISQKDNTSLSVQTNRIKEYCKLFDIELEGIVKETGSGGDDLENRVGLSEIQNLIDNGKCDTIVVNKVDRLGRSLLQGLIFLKYCEEKNVRVICIENGIDTSQPQSKLITNILFSIAENEKDQIKLRCSSGREKTFIDKRKIRVICKIFIFLLF
jgi:site-specific DNA recombinase